MSSRKRQYIGRMATLALQSCETGSHGVSRRRALSTTPHSAGKEPHEPIQRLALYSSGEVSQSKVERWTWGTMGP